MDSAPLRRSRRAALFGLLSSSLLAKVAFGAAALAAVGGVAAAMPSPSVTPTTVTTVIQPLAGTTPASVGTASSTVEEDFVLQAEQFATEVERWGECVAEAARAHSGEAFDPQEACGETPKASDHGLGTAHAPGLTKEDGPAVPAALGDKVDNPNKPVKSGDDDDSEASKDKAANANKPKGDSDDD